MAIRGIFREEGWAMPLLATAIAILCVLLIYTVTRFWFWMKPTTRKGTLPWLQLPLLLGFMFMTGISIVSAVPMSLPACRFLFLGPGIGHVLILAGLLSRVVQLLVNGHVLLQWLLLFFVILNQLVIGLSYMMHVTNCQLNINDQLLMLLYPGLLIGVVLLMIYRTVRSPSSCRWKTQQSVYVGLAASFSGAIAGCWVGAGTMVSDDLLPCCLGFGCLATAIVVPLIVLVPNSRPNTSDSLKPHKDVDVKSFSSSSYTSDDGEDSNYGESKKPTGRGSKKAIPAEPEIIIVPITPGGGVPLPEIAMQAIKAHSNSQTQLHHLRMHHLEPGLGREHRSQDQHHHNRYPRNQYRDGGKHSRPHRWNNKLADVRQSRKSGRGTAKMKRTSQYQEKLSLEQQPTQRTPYNHRGWFY